VHWKCEHNIMLALTIYLMRLADYLAGRRHQKERMRCDVCRQKFSSIEDTETHRRQAHPDIPPRETGIDGA
jgi:hypothetical protein